MERNDGGLAAAEDVCRDYGSRAAELKAEGRRVIGYPCALVPVEIITAAGLVPFRIKGDAHEPITQADALMETIVCSAVRCRFDLALKGHYDFLDGLVVPHACDSIARTYPIWKYSLGLPYTHFLNLPHASDESSLDFFKRILSTFKDTLATFAKREIGAVDLADAVRLHNRNRAVVGQLYELRKPDPPLVSGAELTMSLIGAMGLPVDESTSLLESVVDEVQKRHGPKNSRMARIMIIGAEVADVELVRSVEAAGAYVIADDLCPGARENLALADPTADPIDGLAERYLRKVRCPRTFAQSAGEYLTGLDRRFGHIGRAIADFRVDGVVLYLYRYCDPFGFEAPALKSYLAGLGVPVLSLESEYSMAGTGWLNTRVQAFLETLDQEREPSEREGAVG